MSTIIYPPIKTAGHYLYEVDRDNKIAYCSACGWTEVHIPERSTKEKPKIFCIKRFQELKDAEKDKRRSKPGRTPQHILSEIDTDAMTATCAICGSTKIQKRNHKSSVYYTCATKNRVFTRNYRRTHYTLRSTKPLAHLLSQIDEETKTAVCSRCGPVEIYVWQGNRKIGRRCCNAPVRRIPGAEKARYEINTEIINQHKAEHCCRRCGHNENLLLLHLYAGKPERKELKTEKLLKLTAKALIQELATCEVFCANCRSFANYDLFLENLRIAVDY